MSAPRLRQITALAEDRYLAVFDTDRGEMPVAFTVDPNRGVTAEPDLFLRGQLGDPRPVVAAISAVHAARQVSREAATTVQDRVITRAVEAARRDGASLRTLIDWPLSGVAGVVDRLDEVPEPNRSWDVASGLNELDRAASGDLSAVSGVLPQLVAHFAGAREVRAATAYVRTVALERWRVPEVPPGLALDQLHRLAQLRARAAALDEVYVLVGAEGELPVARTPEGDLLVVTLPEVAG